jgi:CDP-glycerol glycerophosphotransferase (TagB/SpsB family)/uncharacterized coiled-coil DUF342 family protein
LSFKEKIKKLPIIGGLIRLYRLPNLVDDLRVKEDERLTREQALNEIVTNLSFKLDNLSGMVANLHEKADGQSVRTDDLSEKITNLHEKTDGLSVRGDNLSVMVANLHEKADNQSVRTDDLSEKVTNLHEKADGLSVRGDNLSGMVANLHEKANNLSVRTDDLSEKVTNLHEKADGLSVRGDNLSGMVANLHEKADGLSVRTDDLSEKVTNLHEKADGLSVRGDNLSGMVANLHEKVDGLSVRTDDLSEKVTNLHEKADNLTGIVINLHDNNDSLSLKADNLSQQIYNFEIAETINRKIQRDNEQGIIPIIINCEHPQFNHFIEPVVQELFKIPDQKINIFFGESKKEDGSSFFCYNKDNAFPVSIYNRIFGNNILLTPMINVKGPESALKIITNHGICSAKFTFHTKETFINTNIYFVTGELDETKIRKNLEKCELQNKIEVINGGYPKSDYLFQGNQPSKDEIFSKLNLDPRKKTLLYAPSWEAGLSLNEFGVSLIDTILQNEDYNLIVKIHPNSFLISYTGGIIWEEQFKNYFYKQNFHFASDLNINELLIISEIMITDFSSVALEFLALEKPVIYLDCPKFENIYYKLYPGLRIEYSYKELLDDPYSNAGRHVGLVNYDYKNILNDISFLIQNPDYKLNERKEYSQRILSNKGHASEFYANVIISKFIEYSKKYHYDF